MKKELNGNEKTQYLITVKENTETVFKTVNGYFNYMDGLPLAAHKVDKTWIITELSTGLAITSAETRTEAFEKVEPMIEKIKERLMDERYDDLKVKIMMRYVEIGI